MSKGIEQGVTNLIRHWSELAKFANLSASQQELKNDPLPFGISNKHDYYRGVADAFNQASIQVLALLNDSDDAPSAS